MRTGCTNSRTSASRSTCTSSSSPEIDPVDVSDGDGLFFLLWGLVLGQAALHDRPREHADEAAALEHRRALDLGLLELPVAVIQGQVGIEDENGLDRHLGEGRLRRVATRSDHALDQRVRCDDPDQRAAAVDDQYGAHVRSHWFDLALIVVSPPLLVPPEAQALRVLRAARLLRAFAAVGVMYERLGRPLTRNAALVIVGVLFAVILAGGLLIRWVEPAAFPNVLTGYAWAIATLVTAGHAPPEPITVAGRAISSTIVVMGLGSFVALAASLAGRR